MLSRLAYRRSDLRRSYISISYYIQRRYPDCSSKTTRSFTCRTSLRKQNDIEESATHSVHGTDSTTIQTTPTKRPAFHTKPSTVAHWGRWDTSLDKECTLHGYLTSKRQANKGLTFVNLVDPHLRQTLQLLVDEAEIGEQARKAIHALVPHTPVAVTGQLVARTRQPPKSTSTTGPNIVYQESVATEDITTTEKIYPKTFQNDLYVGRVEAVTAVEMLVGHITPLNSFPDDIIATESTAFPPEKRHLQIRTGSDLRNALRLRSKALTECRKYLFGRQFDEIETPILFKSTPEGAREFLVPTRTENRAYALAQSPQQFKQILMASGIAKYFQVARCFRDEDLRADRQPEFTQLDLEMSFASAKDVMWLTEGLLDRLWCTFKDLAAPLTTKERDHRLDHLMDKPQKIDQMSYQTAMERWGSDKPDRRLGSMIYRVNDILDSTLISSFSSLGSPVVEAMKVKVSSLPKKTKKFLDAFLGDGQIPQSVGGVRPERHFAIYDPSLPMAGLTTFKDEEAVKKIQERLQLRKGDLLVLGARPNAPFQGQSYTEMGKLRRELHDALIEQELVPKHRRSDFLWITHFPLFSDCKGGSDPGQKGRANLKSTHHPFTAPLDDNVLSREPLDPKSMIGDHFDLVINGMEIGGGSRRIHNRSLQEKVLRDILKVPEKHLAEFEPLLDALDAGCPPHAGIALGFDRLMTVLLGRESVRDVIAFPKMKNGKDAMMGSPAAVSPKAWKEYHLMPIGTDTQSTVPKSHEKRQKKKQQPASVKPGGAGVAGKKDQTVTAVADSNGSPPFRIRKHGLRLDLVRKLVSDSDTVEPRKTEPFTLRKIAARGPEAAKTPLETGDAKTSFHLMGSTFRKLFAEPLHERGTKTQIGHGGREESRPYKS